MCSCESYNYTHYHYHRLLPHSTIWVRHLPLHKICAIASLVSLLSSSLSLNNFAAASCTYQKLPIPLLFPPYTHIHTYTAAGFRHLPAFPLARLSTIRVMQPPTQRSMDPLAKTMVQRTSVPLAWLFSTWGARVAAPRLFSSSCTPPLTSPFTTFPM